MMYSNFSMWNEENNRILENLKRATPQKMMEELIRSQRDEVQNNIIQLRNELNKARATVTLTTAGYDFGRDMFNAKQAARATINSYKLNWLQYVWNLIDYKRAERYVLKRIKERANKGFTTARFSEIKWPFNKFPELEERLEFLGFEKISADDWGDIKFRWNTII